MVREKFFKIYHKPPKIGIGAGIFGILTMEFSLFTLQIIEVVKDGVVVFQADVNYIGIYDQADCYVEPEDLGVSEFEAGDYTFNVYDSHRGLIVSATCTVA